MMRRATRALCLTGWIIAVLVAGVHGQIPQGSAAGVMAPALAGYAAGLQPAGQFEALLAWVEDGKAPDTLLATRRARAGTVMRSRPLCQYPQVAKYQGSGSTGAAANFPCRSGF
jgi:hypothetical protein